MNHRYARVLTSAALTALLTSCAASRVATEPKIPEQLKVPPAQVLLLDSQASGVQIYVCRASKDDPALFAWVFTAPEAQLFNGAGKVIARHYAGPTWEANDGSKVIGEVVARDDGSDPGAIPWLLLSAKSTAGTGILSRTQFIQRLRTSGGRAPAQSCNQSRVGAKARVPYSADYKFYAGEP
jgi:hypothetical protein